MTGILEGVAVGFELVFGFDLEVDGSRNKASASSSDAGTG